VQDDASVEDIARRIQAETGGFTGGPVESFTKVGRYTLESLQRCGMTPDSNLIDIGCGALRLGYWLVRYLGPGRYFGLEPSKRYVEIGLRIAIGPELAEEKKPRFDYNGDFDFTKFGVPFNFAVARSIFSHASPRMIGQAMDSFRDSAAPGGVMLASYNRMNKGRQEVVDVKERGGEWSWRRYAPAYLQQMASERGLAAEDFEEPFNGQVWLKVTKP